MAQQPDEAMRQNLKEYNLLATFPDVASARRAAGALRLRGIGDESFTVADVDAVPAVDEARMRDELEGMAAGPGLVATHSMTTGAIRGAVAGLVVGAVIGAIVGIAVFGHGSGSHLVGELATVIGFAVGLSVAGAVAGGFSRPRYHPDPGDVAEPFDGAPDYAERDREVVLGVHVDDPTVFALSEEVLEGAAPLQLDRISRHGDVIGTERLGLDAPPVQPGSGRVRE